MPLQRLLTMAALAGAAFAQSPHETAVQKGGELFDKSCTACHGSKAAGGRAPNLTSGDWKHGGTDDAISRNITAGIAGTQMPAFPMPAEDAKAIVTYLRSLANSKPEEAVTGDPEAGASLFFGSAKCSNCHMFQGRGGRLGPDLTAIGSERKLVELRKSIEDCSEKFKDAGTADFLTGQMEEHETIAWTLRRYLN